MAELTAKQQRFYNEYLIDLNATQAAIRAGYSKKTANRIGTENLSKPVIREYIAQRMAEKEASLIADQNEVLEYLTSVMRGTQKEQTLRLAGEGVQEIADIDVAAKERLKAAELIGKRYGMFRDNVNVELEPVTILNDLEE
mgnify:CR=1 FL=1